MSQFTGSIAVGKPQKPRPDFPLFPHATGHWAKKVRGKTRYFGKVSDDPEGQAALNAWLDQKDALLAGREPRQKADGEKTIADLVNRYLTVKRRLLDAGEITPRTFGEYYTTCKRVVASFGSSRAVADLVPDDFGKLRASLAKTRGPVALGNEITRVKMIFTFGKDEDLIPGVRYGQSFDKPSAKVYKKAAAERGQKMFEAAELRLILDALTGRPVIVEGKPKPVTLSPDLTLRTMVLLACNAGFGQSDIGSLPLSALDLAGGWVTFPRPKTGEPRRAKLWPETIEALKASIAIRPVPAAVADGVLVFLTDKGKRWLRPSTGADTESPEKWRSRTDLIGKAFGIVLNSLKINGRRGFYGIRHSFQHAAENSLDLPAVTRVMGHSDKSMSANYRGRITDERLEAVAQTVRAWLFGDVL